jgi:hypothetical protein
MMRIYTINKETTFSDYVNKFIIFSLFEQSIKSIFFGIFWRIFLRHIQGYSHSTLN